MTTRPCAKSSMAPTRQSRHSLRKQLAAMLSLLAWKGA